MIRHLCIQSFSFSKVGVLAIAIENASEPGGVYNASRNAEIEILG